MPSAVTVRRESIVLPTYEPQPPDLNPMFLEKRVYQGSSGRVYPLPFCDRIAEKPMPRAWDAVFLENEFLAVTILPQLGGRIHRLLDKTNGYDVIYYQPVIKPALVGLAGPWASGGIEFNWPQHHRPSTFMPADVHLEQHDDGAVTVWLSEHDPMSRMKGMHGACLHPGRAVLELKVRAYNRTADVQTFLWWANVATRVHEQYQSFFPPDATHVADHAKRALSTFPLCSGRYYGVDYAARARDGIPTNELPAKYRPPAGTLGTWDSALGTSDRLAYAPNDLSWYANIPVPTSYMCMGSHEDFFGGYDHKAQAGLVHVADHHIAPGKKQWTWGNHEFGYAWDRNLTDADENGEFRPYIELMAGVFTDNQPDFSWLQPGETKLWSQFWYPIRQIGPAHHANVEAAASLTIANGAVHLGVAVTAPHTTAVVSLSHKHKVIAAFKRALSPAAPLTESVTLPRGARATDLTLTVADADGRELLRYSPSPKPAVASEALTKEAAKEPLPPEEITSVDELYLTGLHLEQYRHATRHPEDYWRAGYRRDADDSRCHLALGRWHIRRGEFISAEKHLRASIARLTARNPNPPDGEAFYQLGRCLRFLGRESDAYDAFYKATWNQAWQAASYHALSEIDCMRHDWPQALDHLDRSLRLNVDHLRARNLKVQVLRQLGREADAAALLAETIALDPLDWWARHLAGENLTCNTQVRLDLALDYARAGFHTEAVAVLSDAQSEPHSGTAPLIHYYRAWLSNLLGHSTEARRHLKAATKAPPDYCFPARVEEITILGWAIATNPRDARATLYLGHLFYDRRRHREAIAHWERTVKLEPDNAIAWRCLGIGYFNILKESAKARRAYDAAFRANPHDARLLYERDQLWKRLGEAPAKRLRELERYPALTAQRDDLNVELCALYNQTGQPQQALGILSVRRFQPWEGGEGQALGQHVRAHLLRGRELLDAGDAASAVAIFIAALAAPENLGEAKHLLANQSDIHFWLGEALAAAGDASRAREHWTAAATFAGDFQDMSVRSFSEMTYYSALAWRRLGQNARAKKMLRDLLAYARQLAKTPAKIDYFATSLPTMLLFDDDLQARQATTAMFLEAQARLGLGQKAAARRLLRTVLRRDPSHARARDLIAEIDPARR